LLAAIPGTAADTLLVVFSSSILGYATSSSSCVVAAADVN